MTHYSPDWQKHPLVHLVARAVVWIWRWNNDHEGQRPLLGRLTAHMAVVLTLAILIIPGSLKATTLAFCFRFG